MRVRFAPSPTGPLHIGGARTALFNVLASRRSGGTFILRIDDTDRERSTVQFEEDIKSSLSWLGFTWDEGPDCGGDAGPYRQSELLEAHKQAALGLLEKGAAYRDSEGVVRLRYPASTIVFDDLVCGECRFEPEALGGEPALLRSDGTPTYHLASVVDDIRMRITHVIRGQDHLTNTAKHKVLFEALGSEAPVFAHLPLILGEDRSKLSKRNTEGLTTVREFREAGYLPEALVNFLALLGWSHPEERETLSLEEMIAVFDLERVNKTAAKFETNKLNFLNGWWIRTLPVDRIAAETLAFAGEYRPLIESRGEQFWLDAVTALRGYLTSLGQTSWICELLFSLSVPLADDARERFGNDAGRAELLGVGTRWLGLLDEVELEPERDCYTEEQFKKMTKALRKELPFEPKTIFQALRALLTGTLSGPELAALVPLVNRDVLRERTVSIQQALGAR